MKLRFLEMPSMSDNLKPSPDCAACHNGCCGTNTNTKNSNEESVLDEIIFSSKLSM